MGFYLRKSLRAGPFRVNLSRSGIGVSAGLPGFRVGSGPRGNYVRVGAHGIYYQTTLGNRSGANHAVPAPPSWSNQAPPSDIVMTDTTGVAAEALTPTGPGELVEQLNRASVRRLWWPALALVVLALIAVSPFLLLIGVPAVIWLALWERPRRTVLTFYDVSGPAEAWFEQLTSGFTTLSSLAGAWRIQASGAVSGTHQYKVNSGASHLVRRAPVAFGLKPPRTLTTNISVPNLSCGRDALLFLPDRVLVRSGRRWSDVTYAALTVTAMASRFIESGRVPRDAERVDTTWQYVNVKGGPDRRYKNNRQLPVMLYGQLEFTSPAGLRWIIDCSRLDAARWAASVLTGPPPVSAVPPPHPAPAPTARARRAAQPERPVAAAPRPADPMPVPERMPARTKFAGPEQHGELFAYANMIGAASGLLAHAGPYAVIDVETTGFSPASGDRVVEIAIARVNASGRITDEYATLLNPARDTGPVFIHGISNSDVRDAPRFSDVLGDVISRLDGCVIVAHNAAFEERFLAAEFAHAGFAIRQLPALCSLWLGRRTFDTPNHKLATLARHAGIAMPDAHSALGDVRAVAKLLPLMLQQAGTLGYRCRPWTGPITIPVPAGTVRPRTRAIELRRGADGWMASILARLPMSAAEAGDAEAEQYLSALSIALQDGRILGDEARGLAQLAGRAGFGSSQVAALNERFLESLRQTALADGVLTARELSGLRRAAQAVGVPSYFDDLDAGSQPTAPTTGRHAAPPEPVGSQRRCGYCRAVGHYRSTCQQLIGTSS